LQNLSNPVLDLGKGIVSSFILIEWSLLSLDLLLEDSEYILA